MQLKDSESIQKFYADRFTADDNAVKVGWKSKQAQWNRFSQLTKVISSDNFRLNDLGCGLGDYYWYLKAIGYSDFEYHGYDVMPVMIEEAIKLNNEPNAHFKQIQIPEDIFIADYTVASGIFNLKFKMANEQWLEYIHETISVMYSKSLKGIAFNCLTSYADKEYMRDELYYADPCKMFDFCKRKFSRNVALLHDYEEYDFTILVRK